MGLPHVCRVPRLRLTTVWQPALMLRHLSMLLLPCHLVTDGHHALPSCGDVVFIFGMPFILHAAGICTRAPARVSKTTCVTGYIVCPRVVWSCICCNWCTWFLLARIHRLRGFSWICVLVLCVWPSRCVPVPHVTLKARFSH